MGKGENQTPFLDLETLTGGWYGRRNGRGGNDVYERTA